MDQSIELAKILVTPVFILFIIFIFRVPLGNLMERVTKLSIELPTGMKINLSTREVKEIVEAMVREVENLLEDISVEQINELLRIADGQLTAVPQDFVRGTPYHDNILRNLRRRHLIRPTLGGQWQPGKQIDITPFGKLVVRLKREQFDAALRQINRV